MIRKVHISKVAAHAHHRAPWKVGWRTADKKYHRRFFPKKRLAADFAAEVYHDINADMLGGVTPVEWPEVMSAFLDNAKARQLAADTIKQYRDAGIL